AKPVRRSQLFDALADALGIGSGRATRESRPPALPDLPEALAGLRLLVVDDNAVNQKVVVAMLQRLAFEVDVACDGYEAVAAVAQAPYAAVLMDCQMPVMNGYQATAEIRRREAGASRVPIIALTASALRGDEERCIAAGMDAYLAKPVRIDSLAEVLTRLLAP
ncbi:MAG: response regulator, partial [Acidimicrobiales bacterium]